MHNILSILAGSVMRRPKTQLTEGLYIVFKMIYFVAPHVAQTIKCDIFFKRPFLKKRMTFEIVSFFNNLIQSKIIFVKV